MTQIEFIKKLNDLMGEAYIGVISKNDAEVGVRRLVEEYDSIQKSSVPSSITSENDQVVSNVCKNHKWQDVSNNINKPPIFKCNKCGGLLNDR